MRVLAAAIAGLLAVSPMAASGASGPQDVALRADGGLLRDAYGALGRLDGSIEHARSFAMAADLGMADGSALELVKAKRSLTATHFSFGQTVDGVPVAGGFVALHVLHDGRIASLHSRAVASVDPATQDVGEAQAVAAALEAYPGVMHSVRPVLWADGEVGRPAFEATVAAEHSPVAALVYVSRASGVVLEVRETVHAANAPARVWINPITEADDPHLRDRSVVVNYQGLDTPLPDPGTLTGPDFTAYYRAADLLELTVGPLGPRLVGPHANIVNGLAQGDSMLFERGDPRFGEAMAYHWIDWSQRLVQSHGFDEAGNFSVPVHFYDVVFPYSPHFLVMGAFVAGLPTGPEMWFGTWPIVQTTATGAAFRGVATSAEDADVILHEYGHVIMLDSACCNVAAALNEGWADWWSSTQVNRFVGAPYDTCEGEWVRSYDWPRGGGPLPCFRNGRNNLTYSDAADPSLPNHSPHYWGQVWQGALWELREIHGAETLERLLLEANFYMPPEADFRGGVEAILMADYALSGGELGPAVVKEFASRNVTGMLVTQDVYDALEGAALQEGNEADAEVASSLGVASLLVVLALAGLASARRRR